MSMFFSALTPKFYIALTGTSSLISGIILIFEWWYFRKYGQSFIEQISLSHLSPFSPDCEEEEEFEGQGNNATGESVSGNNNNSNNNGGGRSQQQQQSIQECKLWTNPYVLLRGAEYSRLSSSCGKEPLTFYDMNQTAQDHQTYFNCDSESNKADYELMQQAWREGAPGERIRKAKEALAVNGNCVTAILLLAEEESTTIVEAEERFRQAYKILMDGSAKNGRASQGQDSVARRDITAMIIVRRKLAMCARRLGRLKEAARWMKDSLKDYANHNLFNVHENLLECYLENHSYADASAFLTRYDDMEYPKSATICYTAALLKIRQYLDRYTYDPALRKNAVIHPLNVSTVESIHRAVEFNPHVPKYLLELKPLCLPPEHILKRGDSEAVSYAFFHLRHWKAVDGALEVLANTWESVFRLIPQPLEKGIMFFPYSPATETADREILPPYHELSLYPSRDLPLLILVTACTCTSMAICAFILYTFPDQVSGTITAPALYLISKFESVLPYITPSFTSV